MAATSAWLGGEEGTLKVNPWNVLLQLGAFFQHPVHEREDVPVCRKAACYHCREDDNAAVSNQRPARFGEGLRRQGRAAKVDTLVAVDLNVAEARDWTFTVVFSLAKALHLRLGCDWYVGSATRCTVCFVREYRLQQTRPPVVFQGCF